MSIYFRETAHGRNQKDLSPQNFELGALQSQEYLRQNLGSSDRMVDLARRSSTIKKNDKQTQPSSSTNDLKRTINDSNNKDLKVTWPEQYRKNRRIFKEHLPSTIEEDDHHQQKRKQGTSNAEISQNDTRELQRPLEEVMGSIPDGNNIFRFSNNANKEFDAIVPQEINVNISPIQVAIVRSKHEIAYQKALEQDKYEQNNQSESSENIFDQYKKGIRQISQKSGQSSQQNIFDVYKKGHKIKNQKKEKEKPAMQGCTSEQSENIFDAYKNKPQDGNETSSDEENIFEAKKTDKSVLKSSAHEKYTLEKILRTSSLYTNYLIATDRKYIKKISLDIPELKQTQRKVNKIPKEFFFKPERVQFKKMINEPYAESTYGSHQYLCKVNQDRTSFHFQDLRSEQLKNLNGVKCTQIRLEQQDRISPHTEYDNIYQRFYLFSNRQQKILVYSELSMELLCKIPVQKHVINPNIHFCHINGRNFLMLVGGYIRVEKQIAQGNNSIEIFEVNKWFLSLKSRIIKLIIGRINPIFITSKFREEHRFLILGGNAIGKIISEGVLDFSYEKDINQSTNMTGISINCEEITELFDYEEHTNISNVSVKLSDPFCLHSGIVLTLSNNFLLVLPGSLNLFQVKIFHKEINIIEARGSVFMSRTEQYQKRELSLKIERQKLIIYSIDDRGIFHITRQEGKKVEKYRCIIY